MKILIILRHAKAIQGSTSDIDRFLTKEGIEDIKKMGAYFKKTDINPELAICSTAKRAKETLDIFIRFSGIKPKVVYDEIIYGNNENRIIDLIEKTGGAAGTILIAGHLPSVENIVRILTDEKNLNDKFKTSSMAVLKFDINSWNEIHSAKGIIASFVSPDMI